MSLHLIKATSLNELKTRKEDENSSKFEHYTIFSRVKWFRVFAA